jgi:hypothetical protein
VPDEIELGETANIPSARYMYGKVVEKINNGGSAFWKGKPKYERC